MKRRGELSPAFMLLLLRLSIDTFVPEIEFGEWLKQNLLDLRAGFHLCGEPNSTQVEWTFGIWARQQFLARKVTA